MSFRGVVLARDVFGRYFFPEIFVSQSVGFHFSIQVFCRVVLAVNFLFRRSLFLPEKIVFCG